MFYSQFFLLITTICWSSTLIVSAQTTIFTVPTAPCVGPGCSETKPTTTTNSVSPTRDSTTVSTARPSDYQRTVVFINKQTLVGQDLFIRGGIDAIIRPGCEIENAETSPCAISINVNSLGSGDPYLLYDAYRINDTKLDWYGAQVAQGTYLGKPASGTPMAWTTNVPTAPEYQPLNKWGPHYWMTDFDMDCSQTEEGWFEVKAFLTNAGAGWEGDITQVDCTGTGATTPPYDGTTNHLGRCGYVNVYSFSGPGCYIGPFDA